IPACSARASPGGWPRTAACGAPPRRWCCPPPRPTSSSAFGFPPIAGPCGCAAPISGRRCSTGAGSGGWWGGRSRPASGGGACGPDLGPALLYWGVLGVVVAVAIALGLAVRRWRLSIPLSTGQWLLLGIGMSTINTAGSLAVVAWFIALEARRRQALPAKPLT